VVGEHDVAGALAHGQLELEVLGQLLAAPVVHSAVFSLTVSLTDFSCCAPLPVPQRLGVRAPVGFVARVLACTGSAVLVNVWLVVAEVALLEDDARAVHC